MAIVKRRKTLVTDGAGAATGTLGLGARYARVLEVRIDSADDASSDYTIVGADTDPTNTIFTAAAVNGSTSIRFGLEKVEAEVRDTAGEAGAADTRGGLGVIAKSPATITIANGGAAKTHVIDLFCEV